MKFNNKGFTLVELLTVMVILVTILLIAIPSITSSLSRSEDKQMDAKKKAIIADFNINFGKNMFESGYYDQFKAGSCYVEVSELADKNYTSLEFVTNKKGDYINWCISYNSGDFIIETCPNSYTPCGLL